MFGPRAMGFTPAQKRHYLKMKYSHPRLPSFIKHSLPNYRPYIKGRLGYEGRIRANYNRAVAKLRAKVYKKARAGAYLRYIY